MNRFDYSKPEFSHIRANAISHLEFLEAVETVREMMPFNYKKLVEEGAGGDEEWGLDGDDLASFCHNVAVVLELSRYYVS
jgi:hypothetical protein